MERERERKKYNPNTLRLPIAMKLTNFLHMGRLQKLEHRITNFV